MAKPLLSTAPQLTLEHMYQSIVLETNFVSDVMTTVKTVFPSFISGIKVKLQGFQQLEKEEKIKVSGDQKKALKSLALFNYLDLAKIQFVVPEGFNGSLKAYLQAMQGDLEHIEHTQALVKQYRAYLSSIVTNKDSRVSLRDTSFNYTKLGQEREAQRKLIAAFYKHGSYAAKQYYATLFERNGDVEPFFKGVNALNERLANISTRDVIGDVAACTDLLDLFAKRVEEGVIDDVSPAVLKSLSVGAYEIAKEVEYFSSAWYRVLGLTTLTNNLSESLTTLGDI